MLVPTVDPRKGPEEIANVQPSACRPVLRKYPPPKIRKGVPVTRDFPVKLNAPVALRNQISDPKGNNSAYGNVHVCNNGKHDNLSARDSLLSDVSTNATNVRNIHACIEPKEDNVKDSSLSMVVRNEQCQVDVSIATNVYAWTDVKEFNSLMVIGDEQLVVRDEQCPNVLFEVDDYQTAFSDEECEKALLEVNNSQAGVSNNLVITNNDLIINCDKVKEVINLFREVYLELLQERGRKQKGCLPLEASSVLLRQEKWINMDR
ncbi:hypothetical protein CRYUN_Cryun12cG0186200 [Craigia yunnanensis]